jgi:hypothetical protein
MTAKNPKQISKKMPKAPKAPKKAKAHRGIDVDTALATIAVTLAVTPTADSTALSLSKTSDDEGDEDTEGEDNLERVSGQTLRILMNVPRANVGIDDLYSDGGTRQRTIRATAHPVKSIRENGFDESLSKSYCLQNLSFLASIVTQTHHMQVPFAYSRPHGPTRNGRNIWRSWSYHLRRLGQCSSRKD